MDSSRAYRGVRARPSIGLVVLGLVLVLGLVVLGLVVLGLKPIGQRPLGLTKRAPLLLCDRTADAPNVLAEAELTQIISIILQQAVTRL